MPQARVAGKNSGFLVTFRDLPEAITQGESLEECMEEAVGALQAALEGRILENQDIPQASRPEPGEHPIAVPIQTALKTALVLEMRRARITRVELARRLDVDEKEVRRMLDPAGSLQSRRRPGGERTRSSWEARCRCRPRECETSSVGWSRSVSAR